MKGALSWPFVRLYMLTLFYFSANAILNVIIPLRGEALGATNTTIGIIMGAYLLTTMIFRPWAGGIIGRYGPIRVLRIILIVNGLALLIYSFTGLGGYLIARVLQGICTAFFSMALQLGIIDALPDKDRSQGISMYSLCSYMPGIFGPFLAIGMWQSGDMNVFTMFMIAIAVLTGAVGFTARIERRTEEAGAAAAGYSAKLMWQAMGQLGRNVHLRRCGTLMLIASLIFGAVTAFVPLYATQIEGGSAALYLMIQAAVIVAARFLLRSRIPSDGKWSVPFIGGTMVMLIGASLAVGWAVEGGPTVFYGGAVLMGVAQAVLYPTLTTYLSFVLPKTERNILIGLFIATADLGVSLGAIVMGPIADRTSYSTMYLICAVLGVVAAFLAVGKRADANGVAKTEQG